MTVTALCAYLQDRFWWVIEDLLFRHTTPWELDEALEACGFELGPCEAMDLLGLEKVLARCPDRPGPVLRRMVAEGRMGKIGGVGFYRYPGGGGAVIDPLIEDLIREEAWFAKRERRELEESALQTCTLDSLQEIIATALADQASPADVRQALKEGLHLSAERVAALMGDPAL